MKQLETKINKDGTLEGYEQLLQVGRNNIRQ